MILWIFPLLLLHVFEDIDCRGAGPPGSSNRHHQHQGPPGHVGGPGSQLVFPPNPDFGQIVQIDDIQEANEKHIFSDPRGPLGYINSNGEYVPFADSQQELRSKNRPQYNPDTVEETDWHKIDTSGTDNDPTILTTDDNEQPFEPGRAGILYNMLNTGRRHQPGPQGPSRS